MSELVEYHNDINKIPLRNFTDKELNLFFTIIYKAKNRDIKKMKFDFVDLKKLALTGREDKRLIKALENMNYKMLDLKQRVETPSGVIHMFNLFSSFTIDPNNKFMEVEIHENFSYMLNDLPQYTQFELSQLVRLRSSYAKNMFRLLKEFEGSKLRIIFLEEFKRILCVPSSYRASELNKWVITPIMEELSPIFNNLKLEKVKKGRSIDKLIFTWGNRNILSDKTTCKGNSVKTGLIEEVVISEGLNKVIEKVKKNRFIKPLMTNGNIEKLLKKFTDQELTKGLNFASSEIKTEIKSINYLIKTINTGIEEKEIKIVVKKSKPNDLQGLQPREEVKKELTEEITKPINYEVEEFKKNVLEILELKRKELSIQDFGIIKRKVKDSKSFDELNELILKYELN